jgi:hypothetical protein
LSNFSEDEVRRAAEIRQWISKIISEKEEELDKLRNTLLIIDTILKNASFKSASNIMSNELTYNDKFDDNNRNKAFTDDTNQSINKSNLEHETEIRELRRIRDDMLLAHAEIHSDHIKIIPSEDIHLNINTSPFRTFFLARILDGMKSKDLERVRKEEVEEQDTLHYEVNSDKTGNILSLLIFNCRDKERIKEIFSTLIWVITKMLEKGIQQ